MATSQTFQPGLLNAERFDVSDRSERERRNAATARELFQSLARGDGKWLYSKLTPDGETWVLGLTPEMLKGIRADPGQLGVVFPQGMRFGITRVVAEGDKVCVEFTDEAITQHGDEYLNNGVSVIEFAADGRIAAYREYVNPELLRKAF
jgi:ketosteroid isomerase-like protein